MSDDQTRREFLKRLAGAAWMAPTVAVLAPRFAQAASTAAKKPPPEKSGSKSPAPEKAGKQKKKK